MKKIFSFLFLYILVNLAAIAQSEPDFSSYMINRTFANPGFIGAEKTINAVFDNRTKFVGMAEGKPVTSVFGIDAPINLFGADAGAGLMIMSDELGFYNHVHIDASLSYHHTLQGGRLGGGIELGIIQYGLAVDGDGWKTGFEGDHWVDAGSDNAIPNGSEYNEVVLGVGAGVYYETSEFYVGFSASNLNQPDSLLHGDDGISINSDYMAAHYYLTGGYNIKMPSPLLELQPTFMLRTDLASYSLDVNGTFFYDSKYWFGGGFRTSFRSFDAITLMGGIKMKNGLNLGYALDINTTSLILVAPTSHEVFVTYSFNLDKKRNQKYKSVRFL